MRAWILRLIGVSILSASALSLVPQGGLRKTLSAVCAFAVLSVALSLSNDFDWGRYSLYLSRYRQEGERLAMEGEERLRAETRLGIQRGCEAYILDKAQALGVEDAQCSVDARWDEVGYWVPYACTVTYKGSESSRRALSTWIEVELGIPESGQSWSTQGETTY